MKKKDTLAEQVRQMQEDARKYDNGYSDGYDIANSLKYFINFEGQSPDFNRGFTGGFNDGRLDTPALWEYIKVVIMSHNNKGCRVYLCTAYIQVSR